MKEKSIKGITLVALVVTIIILLILAGVAITALKQTGLFENAKQAKNAMENAQNTENVTLAEYSDKINEVTGSRDTVTISKEEYNDLKNANIYSSSETRVGTWIDGKPLYRKVIREEIKEYGNKEYFFSQNVPEAESYIIESAYAFQDASYTGSGIEVSSSNTADTQYDISFTSFNLVNGRVWLVRGENSPRYLQLIVKYTKLTD